MVRSVVRPDEIFLRDKLKEGDDLYLILKIRTNIKEASIVSDEGSRQEFEYDEYEIKYKVPDVSSIEEVKQSILTQRDTIISSVKTKQELSGLSIDSLREKLLEVDSISVK